MAGTEGESLSFIQKLATSVGTSEAALKILISILFGEFQLFEQLFIDYKSSNSIIRTVRMYNIRCICGPKPQYRLCNSTRKDEILDLFFIPHSKIIADLLK